MLKIIKLVTITIAAVPILSSCLMFGRSVSAATRWSTVDTATDGAIATVGHSLPHVETRTMQWQSLQQSHCGAARHSSADKWRDIVSHQTSH